MKPIWRKVTEIERGVYLDGGFGDKPYELPNATIAYDKAHIHTPRWYARVCDYVEPEMPSPDLKDGDPVLVRDYAKSAWVPANFANWRHDGTIVTWTNGNCWASGGGKFSWNHYRVPSVEELKDSKRDAEGRVG